MAIHTLNTSLILKTSRDEAWAFFSNPANLSKITPTELDFQIVTPDLPARIHAGMMIEYRVRPLFGLPMTWLTEITHVRDGEYFVDEQRVGPYAIWHHEHLFEDLGGGRIRASDRVSYRLPFQPLSELTHGILVKPQLDQIFRFRETAIRKYFDVE
ncbi:MAG: SRPBCC family protein [Verrucomicrobiaceae bacterium]|nr:SRPBCC family protein [Verrucomicrobiaceae bacterium]